jgi:hypothetical protein
VNASTNGAPIPYDTLVQDECIHASLYTDPRIFADEHLGKAVPRAASTRAPRKKEPDVIAKRPWRARPLARI